MPPNSFEIVLDEQHAGTRLDVFLAQAIEDVTRSLIQKLIKDGQVTVNGTPTRRPGRSLGAAEGRGGAMNLRRWSLILGILAFSMVLGLVLLAGASGRPHKD